MVCRAIEKWDGVLPTFVGDSWGIFLDVVRAMEQKDKKTGINRNMNHRTKAFRRMSLTTLLSPMMQALDD